MVKSQYFIPIVNIKNDLVYLKDGYIALVLSTSAVNFGLLFETEQMAIIQGFAGFLNSLSFPIQIAIRSTKLDVSVYLSTLDKAMQQQTSPLLKQLTVQYRQFVESLIKENNVLDKQFYICLYVSPAELGVLSKTSLDLTKKAFTVLTPRRDHIIRQLARMGLKAKQLTTVDLIKLYYDIYNPPAIQTPAKNSVFTVATPAQTVTAPRPPVPQTILTSPVQTPPIVPFPIARLPNPNVPLKANLQTSPNIFPTVHLAPPFVVEELT